MSAPRTVRIVLPALIAALSFSTSAAAFPASQDPAAAGGRLDRFRAAPAPKIGSALVRTPGRFSGYTNYWQDIAWTRHQYGNLFQMSTLDPTAAVVQAKRDTAEELGLAGLDMEEGFLAEYAADRARRLDHPNPAAIESALAGSAESVLVSAPFASEAGRRLAALAPAAAPFAGRQAKAKDYAPVRAFILRDGPRRLYAVLSDSSAARARFVSLLADAVSVLSRFDLHRGWFGTGTLLHSVTCFPGHPLEVIAQGMNQGNDWFTFNGYMDYLLQPQLPEWLGKVGLDVVTDVGTGKATHSLGTIAYGLRDWDGLKIQDMPTEEEWIKFVKDRGGYLFRPIFAPECGRFAYDGVLAVDGNQRQADEEDVPFVLQTGMILEEAPAGMVLFTPKDGPFTREVLWKAILERRAAGILPLGKMMGPRLFRSALQMLWLDRIFLEKRFGDAVQLAAEIQGRVLSVRLAGAGATPLSGTLSIRTAPGVSVVGETSREVSLHPERATDEVFRLALSREAMGRANPILIEFRWPDGRKRTLAVLDLPPAVSIPALLYGQAASFDLPVSIHNFGDGSSVPFRVEAFRKGDKKAAYARDFAARISPDGWAETSVRLPLPPGGYEVIVTALGCEARSQIGVEAPAGKAVCTPVDVNGDGVMEYRLENSKVRALLLATGARVIEYTVKAKDDNVLFKLWPEKETATDRRPFRERGFYPYGGFEDFLGQASIETHKVYAAEVVQAEGPLVRVRMWADYYGNRLEKVFTLYGDSPLLEIRFALDFVNPELNMLGPQPILEIGKRHGPEDLFVVPEKDGLSQFRMRPDEYFGRVLHPVEGWNAGYDEVEDIAFVGAFPVREPEFLHMWMNHPSNGESNHYYAEFQPWVPIFQKTRRYFSYYLWAAPGGWKPAVEELRRRNLISSR
jgi:hypothetical protein